MERIKISDNRTPILSLIDSYSTSTSSKVTSGAQHGTGLSRKRLTEDTDGYSAISHHIFLKINVHGCLDDYYAKFESE